MAGRLVDIVLGAAEDNTEWTVCRRANTADASTQTSKEGDELRSIVYKMIHGSTTFQLLDEHGDTFVKNYGTLVSISSKMRLDAYQHLKSKFDAEKQQQKEQEQKEQEQKEQEQKEQEQKEKQRKEEQRKEEQQKEKQQKEKEQKVRMKKKKERMRILANLVKKRKALERLPLNTRFETMVATPINVTNSFDS